MSDVDVGSYLSGGMDSGSITALAAGQLPYMKTFTCGFDLSNFSLAILSCLALDGTYAFATLPVTRATISSETLRGASAYFSKCMEYVARPCVRERRSVE